MSCKAFQTKAKANGFVPDDAALNYLAESLNGEDYIPNPSDLPVVDSNYSKEETLAGIKNYGETSSTAFNDRTIGAKPLVGDATRLTGDDKAVRDYYDEHNPRDASVIPQLGGEALAIVHGANAGIGNVAQGVYDLVTSPLDTSKQAANGFMNTLEAFKHPEEMFAESNKGNIEAELDRRDIFGANSFDAGYHQGQSDVKAIATAAEIAGVLAPEVYLAKTPRVGDNSARGVGPDGRSTTPKVTAEAEVDGVKFNDTNQNARPSEAANPNIPTLISDDIQVKIDKNPDKPFPNGNMATAHAEVGAIQQAYDAGKTQGKNMTMRVTGEDVCDYCRSDLRKAADKSGLNSLSVYEETTGRTLTWTRREDGTIGKVKIIEPEGGK
uniref:Putative cytidine deaminase C-terminal domain-containing protein n=1 Tax=Marinomonas sp. (strain MWYL1) TaxID=400668 RepID=A6W0N3_MARMS